MTEGRDYTQLALISRRRGGWNYNERAEGRFSALQVAAGTLGAGPGECGAGAESAPSA